MEEAGSEVAVVGGVAWGEGFGLLVEFEELVLGDAGVEPGEAGEGGGGGAAGDDEAEAGVEAGLARGGAGVASGGAGGGGGGVVAAVLEPKDADGKDAVDGGLGLGGVDGDDGPGVLAAEEGAAGVGGAEGALEVGGGAEGFALVVGEGAEEDAIEEAEVAAAGSVAGGERAEVLVGGELEVGWMSVAEALGGEAEGAGAGGDGDDAADEVPLGGPEVEGGAILLGGEGELGFAEVEEGAAVFEQEGVGVLGEVGFDGGGDVGGRLGGLLGARDAACAVGCWGRHRATLATASGCWDSTSAGAWLGGANRERVAWGWCGEFRGVSLLGVSLLGEGKVEVETGDAEALAEVEGVGVLAVGAGVEREGVAGGGAGMVDEPMEHGFAMAERAGGGGGDEVVDVEGFVGGEHALDAEAGDSGDGAVVEGEKGEVVALGLLGADAFEEGGFAEVRAELEEDGEAAEDVVVGGGEVDGGHWRPRRAEAGPPLRDKHKGGSRSSAARRMTNQGRETARGIRHEEQ